MNKAQLSLEFLLVFAALTAFLAVFLPIYSSAQNQLKLKTVETTQEIAFQKILGLAKQAQILGSQSSLVSEIILQANDTAISFDETRGALEMTFSYSGVGKTFSQKTPFSLEINAPPSMEKGKYSIQAKGGLQTVLTIERQE